MTEFTFLRFILVFPTTSIHVCKYNTIYMENAEVNIITTHYFVAKSVLIKQANM